jgi:hypothetical protein
LAVAQNPSTSDDTLLFMIHDPEKSVRKAGATEQRRRTIEKLK